MYTYSHLHDLYVSVSNMDTFLWLKKTHIKWPKQVTLKPRVRNELRRYRPEVTKTLQNASRVFGCTMSLLWLLQFLGPFLFTSNSLWQGPSLHFSSFRASQKRFFSIFPSKSAKVAVDFKGALFFVQIITSKGGFSRVVVYSVLMGLVRFWVIINHGCSMVRRFPLVYHLQSSMQHKATRKIIKG